MTILRPSLPLARGGFRGATGPFRQRDLPVHAEVLKHVDAAADPVDLDAVNFFALPRPKCNREPKWLW